VKPEERKIIVGGNTSIVNVSNIHFMAFVKGLSGNDWCIFAKYDAGQNVLVHKCKDEDEVSKKLAEILAQTI
jgi:hypothetical protein